VGEPISAAHESPDAAARQLRRIILNHLTDIGNLSSFRRSRRRYRKFRQIGEFTKNLRGQPKLDEPPSPIMDSSKSRSPQIEGDGLRFQETKSLEAIDPLDHIH